MTLYIIIPVKRLAESKSRLASVLAAAERHSLALTLLRRVLAVVQEAQQRLPARGVVVSADADALNLAQSLGITPLPEQPFRPEAGARPEAALNLALEQATAWAAGQGAGAVLILPADLPLITLADIEGLWQAAQQLYSPQAVVIAADGRRQGTNALLVRPPGALRYQFGVASFQRHCQQARERGMACHVHDSARLGLDVDVPADLDRYLAVERADLEGMGFEESEEALIDARLEAFLVQPELLMRLGTLGRDGYPHVTPVWYLYEDGFFYITTARDRVKTRNMLANPKVGFAIDSATMPYRGASFWGEARLAGEGEAARAITGRIAARYTPADHLAAMVDALMQTPRVVFAIEPVRAVRMGSWES